MGSCSVLEADDSSAGRMRALTDDEEISMRRRLSRVPRSMSMKPLLGQQSDSSTLPALPSISPDLDVDEEEDEEPGCVLYHCFARERGCEEPADDSKCLRWSSDGAACETPLCRYKDDQLLMQDMQTMQDMQVLASQGQRMLHNVARNVALNAVFSGVLYSRRVLLGARGRRLFGPISCPSPPVYLPPPPPSPPSSPPGPTTVKLETPGCTQEYAGYYVAQQSDVREGYIYYKSKLELYHPGGSDFTHLGKGNYYLYKCQSWVNKWVVMWWKTFPAEMGTQSGSGEACEMPSCCATVYKAIVAVDNELGVFDTYLKDAEKADDTQTTVWDYVRGTGGCPSGSSEHKIKLSIA